MTSIYDSYAGQVAPVEYHYWNLTDPFYAFNIPEDSTRAAYYGAGGVPTFRYDGQYIQDLFVPYEGFYDFFRWTVDSLIAIPSPIRINLYQYPSEDWDSAYVSFDVVAVDSLVDTDPILYLAVVEKYHRYPYPVGRWDYAFRDMIPDADGEPINLQAGDSLHFEWCYPCTSLYNSDAIVTTIWVQNDATVMVGGTPQDLPGDCVNKVQQAASQFVTDVSAVARGEAAASVWLGRSRPNPFTTETRITYAVAKAGRVRLSVYTPTGRLVEHLIDDYLGPGSYSATWDGRDRFGSAAGSGMYYYRLETEAGVRTGRTVLLR
jgi:hypothetical protein